MSLENWERRQTRELTGSLEKERLMSELISGLWSGHIEPATVLSETETKEVD